MKKIALISCGSLKVNKKSKVKNLYIGDLFKKSLNYCLQNYDEVYVLSAKYGLLHLEEEIEPYNVSLHSKTIRERKEWAYKVYKQIEEKIGLNNKFYLYTGKLYREYLLRVLNSEAPLSKLTNNGLGYQKKFYKDNTK